MADRIIVLLDTPVLFSAPLRDTLLRAARLNLFDPKWSIETLDELARNLVGSRRMTDASFERLASAPNHTFPEATVFGYSDLQTTLINHPKDRHVLAAAVVSRSVVIVTPNLRDICEAALSPFNVRAISPDDFLLRLLENDPETVQVVIDLQWRSLRRPLLSRDQVLDALAVAAPKFAEAMRTPLT